jgi:hypothetical protein
LTSVAGKATSPRIKNGANHFCAGKNEMRKTVLILSTLAIALCRSFAGADTPESLAREAAISQFTQKMQDANYPALFEKAAKEFNVPVQILEGISFAETRWEHLTWPPGETVSPENGMPHAYGIMSLWDNDHFGHNLIEAANLIGKTPDDLKNDPLDNMRGAAAYLRQLYDKTPKPDGTSEGDLESWRNAIADYTGIPEVDLKQQHALSVYEWLAQGFNQFGIKLDPVPNLKLEPMRTEVNRIVSEERAKRAALYAMRNGETNSTTASATPVSVVDTNRAVEKSTTAKSVNSNAVVAVQTAKGKIWWYVIAGLFIVGMIGFYFRHFFGRRK